MNINENCALFLVTETFEDEDGDTGQITSTTKQYACSPENLSMYVDHVNYSRKIAIEKLEVNPNFAKESYRDDDVPYLSLVQY